MNESNPRSLSPFLSEVDNLAASRSIFAKISSKIRSLSNKSWCRYNGLVRTFWAGISPNKLPSLLLFFSPCLIDPLIAISLNFRDLDVFLWSLHVLCDVPMPDFFEKWTRFPPRITNGIFTSCLSLSSLILLLIAPFFEWSLKLLCHKKNVSKSHSVDLWASTI